MYYIIKILLISHQCRRMYYLLRIISDISQSIRLCGNFVTKTREMRSANESVELNGKNGKKKKGWKLTWTSNLSLKWISSSFFDRKSAFCKQQLRKETRNKPMPSYVIFTHPRVSIPCFPFENPMERRANSPRI